MEAQEAVTLFNNVVGNVLSTTTAADDLINNDNPNGPSQLDTVTDESSVIGGMASAAEAAAAFAGNAPLAAIFEGVGPAIAFAQLPLNAEQLARDAQNFQEDAAAGDNNQILTNDFTAVLNDEGQLLSNFGILMAEFAPELLPLAAGLTLAGTLLQYATYTNIGNCISLLTSLINAWSNGNYQKLQAAENQKDPIFIDLSGNGLSLTTLSTSGAYFDFSGSGFAEHTSWMGSGTGMLVFDPTGAAVTSDDLISSFSALQALAGGAQTIDSSNSIYSQLRVWVDSNGDGKVDAGELKTLSQLGIASINLDATSSGEILNGNVVNQVSNITMVDGSTREIASVSLVGDPSTTVADTPAFIPSSISLLPQVEGGGDMSDLRSEMTTDQTLESEVQEFLTLGSDAPYSDITNAVKTIMYEWDGVASVNPNSRGPQVNAKQLEFIEAYSGESYSSPYGSNPIYHAAPGVDASWNDLFATMFAKLVLQSPNLQSLVPEFSLENGAIVAADGFSSIAAAFARLGDLSASNVQQWQVFLTVADAYRIEVGTSAEDYYQTVVGQTSDSSCVMSWRFAPVRMTASGMPCASTMRWCLLPSLRRSVGFGPV
ncbi:hypothetical protein SAMN05421548_1693, partial [Paraburkholderia lycopersici]